MVFAAVLDNLRNIESKFYSGTCHDASVLVHDQKSTVSSHRSQTVVTVLLDTRLCGIALVPTVLLLEKKQVKNPAPFLIQQVLAPTAAEGSAKKCVGQTPQTTPIP